MNQEVKSEPKWVRWLLIIWFATLPFTHALTIEIGFPFKIYEVVFLLLVLGLCLQVLRRGSFSKFDWMKPYLGIFICLGVLLVVYGVSYIFGMYLIEHNFKYLPRWSLGFSMPPIYSLSKYLYLIADVVILMIIIRFSKQRPQTYLDAFLFGALICSLYSLYLFISCLFHVEPYLLPGITEHNRVGLWGAEFIRHGTFKEGNHLALYIILALVLSVFGFEHYRNYRYLLIGLTCLFAVVTTFSTMGLILAFLLITYYLLSKVATIKEKKFRLPIFLIVFGVALVSVLQCWDTPYAQKFIVQKLFAIDNKGYSRRDRIRQTKFGLTLFANYPFTGVGPGNYGYYFDRRNRRGSRSIANNAYTEVLAEGGTFAFAALMATFYFMIEFLYRRHKNKGVHLLMVGLLLMCVGLITYPSFSVMFLWGYCGLALVLAEPINTKDA